jgi:N-acetylglucosamine-6-sulfatase
MDFTSKAAGWITDDKWAMQHKEIVAIPNKDKAAVVIVGDSISQSWGGPGRKVWAPGDAAWASEMPRVPRLNTAVTGDSTQHILWRLRNGEIKGAKPKIFLVMAGTNNMPHFTPEQIAGGIVEIINELRTASPQSKILLQGILPRGDDAAAPLRKHVVKTNLLLSGLADGAAVHFFDFGPLFLDEDGRPHKTRMAVDKVHLTAEGYRVWARAIAPIINDWTS